MPKFKELTKSNSIIRGIDFLMKAKVIGAVLAGLAILGHQTHANSVLSPGSTIVPTPTTFGGTLLADATQYFIIGSADRPSGSVESRVYSGDPSNPFSGLGGLTFVYQITISDSALPLAGIEHFTANNFAGYVTAVGCDVSSGTAVPTTVSRAFPGTPVEWNFALPTDVVLGQPSVWLVIDSNALTFDKNVGGLIDGATVDFDLFGPTGPATGSNVPDGVMTLCLLGFALSGVEVLRRRFIR